MLIDARKLTPGATVDTDVCIVGAGAAGIAIARELRNRKVRICLLESGGFDPDDATQRLYTGASLGRKYYRLDNSRTRFFGGSTNCWMGICRPLDADDFEVRAWIPHSGWPFDRQALLPYYERAQAVCQLGPFRYEGVQISRPLLPQLPLHRGGDVVTRCFHVAPTRFGEVYRDEITSAENIDTYLHANVVELEPGEGVRAVERVHVKTLDGNAFQVRPKAVVLATGGIENVRLLLASQRVQTAGLGNANDLVGRFFMEHPHTVAGEFLPSGALQLGLYRLHRRGNVGVLGLVTLSEAARRREQLANFTTTIDLERPLDPFERDLASSATAFSAPLRETRPTAVKFALSNECEQVPNPESRVRLSHDRDALGMNRAMLKWRLTPEDKHSLQRSHEILARELGRSGVGRMRLSPDLAAEGDGWPKNLIGGRHHMGTTRMHPDPKRGVVDADSRVHGLANLFVAGSSVFPTSGSANPTLTIVALALRLVDHLKARFA